MSIRINFLSAAALSFGLMLPAFADEKPTADTVIATVNGTEITLGQMILLRSTLPEQYTQLPDDVLFTGILEQLIQQTALSQEHQGEAPKRVAIALENERRSLLAAGVIDKVLAGAMTDNALQKAHEKKYGEAAEESEFKAAHILVETEAAAKALVTELEAGADFAELAREHSTGPSGPSGGELGWFGKGMMVPPFEEAVTALEAGGISAPVQTQFGWHVIKLAETRVKAAPKLEDVREELENTIQQKTVGDYISGLVSSATVEREMADKIDPALLKELDLLED